MSMNSTNLRWRGLLAVVGICGALLRPMADGIPEPGLVMYGSVANTAGGFPLSSSEVLWIPAGADSRRLPQDQ